jgi:hypothetical protein
MRLNVRFLRGLTLGLLLAVADGCGSNVEEPPTAHVKGQVTLDGKPADFVMVQFAPIGSDPMAAGNVGAPSTAITDESGNFVLVYKDGVEGAVIGMHNVAVMRPEAFEPNPDGSVPTPKGAEIPQKYWLDSGIKKEVIAGENNITIELTSQ